MCSAIMIVKLAFVTLLSTFFVSAAKVQISKCGGCHKIKSECPEVTQSGIFCDSLADREKIRAYSHPNETANNGTLAACVPSYYEVTADITDWCCFWNPAIGCQQLTGSYYQQHSDWHETCELCLHSCECETKNSAAARSCLSSVLFLLCLTILGIYWEL
ncbi:uncharacterized protein LOC117897017 [Drosophila subobscura]|uniref:uncharacterized protein LOC117897017 n=1 Tax=Drosophila subobscura TaxID=7241 RepID=UPI00155ACF61|nr:uncharacterized protein LOC117897017 [Drosophila subobscura]